MGIEPQTHPFSPQAHTLTSEQNQLGQVFSFKQSGQERPEGGEVANAVDQREENPGQREQKHKTSVVGV